MLINGELSICKFLLIILFQFYPCYYLVLSFYSCNCWVSIIRILNLIIFSCYSNLLLRRRKWTRILQWEVLGYVLRRLPFLWSYRVFRYSVSLRVVIVFRDINYIIIIRILNLIIFPCYSNLLLRRRKWTRILWWEVLGYVLHRLPFMWSYVVFRYSVSLRVVIVFRDINYVIIILYLWHLIICEHF
jgi:hypothetical protein